jgi:hypothetical protein
MVKYKKNTGLNTRSFTTKMRSLDKAIKNELDSIDLANKNDINVEEIIINSVYKPGTASTCAEEEQNVIIIYTLIKKIEL